MNASSGAIMVRSKDDENLLVCGASYNMPQVWEELVNKVEDNPNNMNGTVAYTGRPMIANKVDKIFHGYPVGSVIVVPIFDDDRVVANIEVIHDIGDKTFNNKDLEYLQKEAIKLANSML